MKETTTAAGLLYGLDGLPLKEENLLPAMPLARLPFSFFLSSYCLMLLAGPNLLSISSLPSRSYPLFSLIWNRVWRTSGVFLHTALSFASSVSSQMSFLYTLQDLIPLLPFLRCGLF